MAFLRCDIALHRFTASFVSVGLIQAPSISSNNPKENDDIHETEPKSNFEFHMSKNIRSLSNLRCLFLSRVNRRNQP